MNIVSPSILAADFANLERDIHSADRAKWLHVDVMDGHFVPNLSIGPPVVESVRRVTGRFLDVHLMITDPLAYVEPFARAGADLYCFHIETGDPAPVLAAVRCAGMKAGLALRPGTDASLLLPWLEQIDLALVMTVEPGFGGQAFQQEMLPKLRTLRTAAQERNPALHLEVDGGINSETAALCVQAGADVLVAGSYVFGAADREKAIQSLEEA